MTPKKPTTPAKKAATPAASATPAPSTPKGPTTGTVVRHVHVDPYSGEEVERLGVVVGTSADGVEVGWLTEGTAVFPAGELEEL